MPAVLTHKTIMLLARERVNDIRKVLQKKVDDGDPLTTLDRQMLAIADKTAEIFTSEPRPRTKLPGVAFTELVGNDTDSYPISQYAVLGSMGPDIAGFSAILAPGQDWVFDNVHKGTPDPNRELVNSQSCDFILEFWNRASHHITSDISDVPVQNAQLDKMRAYVLGHLCHIAADVVSHPYVNDFEWEEHRNDLKKFHAKAEGEMDALVAKDILRRESTRAGQEWDRWWPSEDLPSQFFTAYEEALEEVYKAGTDRRKGLKEFEEHLASLGEQEMNADFIEDGYKFLRHGVVSKGYGYGYWSWWGWLSLLAVPALALPIVTAAMPRGGQILLSDDGDWNERAWLEFVTTPLFFGLPASIGYGSLLGCLTTRGVEGRYWTGMIGSIVSAVLGIVTFVTSATEEELDPGFSWLVLFGVPAGSSLAQAIMAVVAWARGERGGRMAIGLIFSIPLMFLAAFFIFFLLVPPALRVLWNELFGEETTENALESGVFWFTFLLWAAGILVMWFIAPPWLRDKRIPEQPQGDIIDRRFVRLFDDTTLHEDSELAGLNIPSEVYPSGRRLLAKLFWTGTGDIFVRSDRYQLQFSSHEDGRNPQIVPAPIAPMSLAEYLEFLKQTVTQPGAATVGLLQGARIYQDDPDYDLPSGATFGDNGDGEKNQQDHDSEAPKFKKLGTSADNTEFILHHAYKAAQAVRYGEQGAVPPERNLEGAFPITFDPDREGYKYIHNPTRAQASEALMSRAGDFGAILSMGAVTHMVSGLQDSKNNSVNKIYQVFRNWNLDRRRVNEWRTVVAGGALSEKGASRSGWDDNMLGNNLRPADHATWTEALLGSSQAAFDEGEQSARQLGWTDVVREWMEVSRTAGANTLDATPRPGKPSHQALSRAMAYLFDLSDPTASPP